MTTHDNIVKKLQFWHEEKKKIVNILELFLYVFLSILFTLIYTVRIHMMVYSCILWRLQRDAIHLNINGQDCLFAGKNKKHKIQLYGDFRYFS